MIGAVGMGVGPVGERIEPDLVRGGGGVGLVSHEVDLLVLVWDVRLLAEDGDEEDGDDEDGDDEDEDDDAGDEDEDELGPVQSVTRVTR